MKGVFVLDLTTTATDWPPAVTTSGTVTIMSVPAIPPFEDDWTPPPSLPPAIPMKRLPLDGRRHVRARHGFQQMARVPCYRGSRPR